MDKCNLTVEELQVKNAELEKQLKLCKLKLLETKGREMAIINHIVEKTKEDSEIVCEDIESYMEFMDIAEWEGCVTQARILLGLDWAGGRIRIYVNDCLYLNEGNCVERVSLGPRSEMVVRCCPKKNKACCYSCEERENCLNRCVSFGKELKQNAN